MRAEIGIDEDGRPFLQIEPISSTEASMLKYVRPCMPFSDYNDGCGTVRILGTRLPGGGGK